MNLPQTARQFPMSRHRKQVDLLTLNRLAWLATSAAALLWSQRATPDSPPLTIEVLDTLILGEIETGD